MKDLLNIDSAVIKQKQNEKLEQERQEQKRRIQTGLSMQNTVNNALAKRMPQNNGAQMPVMESAAGWGATK